MERQAARPKLAIVSLSAFTDNEPGRHYLVNDETKAVIQSSKDFEELKILKASILHDYDTALKIFDEIGKN